jgi:excisionase family DNA binding protein
MSVDRHTPYRDLPEWLSVEEIRTYLAIGRTAAYDALRTQTWPTLKVGRLVRVHKSAFAPKDLAS